MTRDRLQREEKLRGPQAFLKCLRHPRPFLRSPNLSISTSAKLGYKLYDSIFDQHGRKKCPTDHDQRSGDRTMYCNMPDPATNFTIHCLRNTTNRRRGRRRSRITRLSKLDDTSCGNGGEGGATKGRLESAAGIRRVRRSSRSCERIHTDILK
jgi:hypothetical protein